MVSKDFFELNTLNTSPESATKSVALSSCVTVYTRGLLFLKNTRRSGSAEGKCLQSAQFFLLHQQKGTGRTT